jgi:hypothetical protein
VLKKGTLRSRIMTTLAAAVLLLAPTLAAPVQAAPHGDTLPGQSFNAVYHALRNGTKKPDNLAKPTGGATTTNGMVYHGGPVMLGTVHTYVIWYGNWSGNSATTILQDLLGHIGGSPYYNINTTYYNGSNQHLSNSVSFTSSTTDNYSLGKSLSDANIQTIVASAISSGRLPSDTNGVYFVLTSGDVAETSGFLTQYCGWHTHGTIGGQDIKYSFVGDPSKNYAACAEQATASPNGNISADAMASVIAHELEEATTDPDLNAWYDRRGSENADKCAWTFGTTYTVANGSMANMKLGTRDYLIQRNWVNANGGLCILSW